MSLLPSYILLYDGACRICTAQARDIARYDTDHRIGLLDLNAPAARERYPQISPTDAQRWMHIVGPDGRIWRGADAVRLALLLLPLGRALGALLYLPGVMRIARPLYDWFARNRYRFGGYSAGACAGGACAVRRGLEASYGHEEHKEHKEHED
jgi:predicted DCC family thiol-disulfide oxidoreductase YuxK